MTLTRAFLTAWPSVRESEWSMMPAVTIPASLALILLPSLVPRSYPPPAPASDESPEKRPRTRQKKSSQEAPRERLPPIIHYIRLLLTMATTSSASLVASALLVRPYNAPTLGCVEKSSSVATATPLAPPEKPSIPSSRHLILPSSSP
jgi:hypothetical protein